MRYPNNDLWSVRQIEYLYDALNGYDGKHCVYYVDKKVKTSIPDIAEYEYVGVIVFEGQDRTIMFEQGENYGLKESDVIKVLDEKRITYDVVYSLQNGSDDEKNTNWRNNAVEK